MESYSSHQNPIEAKKNSESDTRQSTNPLEFLEVSDTALSPDQYLDNRPWSELKLQVEAPIVVEEWESPYSTVVGTKKTGKSATMEAASTRLGIKYVDAGLPFRAIAQKAMENGYRGGEMSLLLLESLLRLLQSAEINFAQPDKGIDQSIILGDTVYEYARDLAQVDGALAGQVSQIPAILHLSMDLLKQQVEQAHQLMLVGGRSLNQIFPTAMAKFYVEREGVFMPEAEKGTAWNPDSPQNNPNIIRLFNQEGQLALTAEAMALVVARRAEARVSDDHGFQLPAIDGLLVTAEPAKAQEINYALAHRPDILRLPNNVVIPPDFLAQMREGLEIKARHARTKFKDPLLIVESTALYLPDLYQRGILSEFVEWASKKHPQRLASLLNQPDSPAAAITLMALIDEQGETQFSQGVVSGKFLKQGQGEGGFGWDQNFIADGFEQTYAQMAEQKYIASSRALAANELRVN